MAAYKLTEDQVYDIKERILRGERQQAIADLYEVDVSTVSNIKNNKHWKEIQIEVDLSEKPNFWSYYQSDDLIERTVKLYKKGYSQNQIAALLNKYIKTLDAEIRPKKIAQPHVSAMLNKNGVKTKPRGSEKKYLHLLPDMKKMRENGCTLDEIALELNIDPTTVGRYLKK